MREIFEFEWDVPDGGFQWVDATVFLSGSKQSTHEKPRRMLTPADTRVRYMARVYRPLSEYPGLFHTFAETQPNEDAILAFANAHGSLGGEAAGLFGNPQGKDKPSPVRIGEPLDRWVDEIITLRQTLALWEMVQKEDREGLSAQRHRARNIDEDQDGIGK